MSNGDRVVLVTGGGKGIGLAISRRFLSGGSSVFICQDRMSDLESGLASLSAFGNRVSGVVGDLAEERHCRRVVDDCIARMGHIDVLVNNAAITGPNAVGSIREMDDAVMSRIVDVNLKAAYRCARYASDAMVGSSRRGTIVNIGSVASFVAQDGASAYTMTKAGLLGLTKALALELSSSGVRAVMVAPGDIDTASSSDAAYLQMRYENEWHRRTPLGRGTAEDIAETVAFLCSESARFISGCAVVVDGGLLSY